MMFLHFARNLQTNQAVGSAVQSLEQLTEIKFPPVDSIMHATTSLENGIETTEVNGDTVDSCSESSISDQTEESVSPQTSSTEIPSTQTPLQRRRGLLQPRINLIYPGISKLCWIGSE
ncbi:unnamed protein product [Arctogadus glacialis]